MLPGVIGVLQANEALKIIVGYGEPLVGRLLTFDAQQTEFGSLKLKRDPKCPTCGSGAVTSSVDVAEQVTVSAGADGSSSD